MDIDLDVDELIADYGLVAVYRAVAKRLDMATGMSDGEKWRTFKRWLKRNSSLEGYLESGRP